MLERLLCPSKLTPTRYAYFGGGHQKIPLSCKIIPNFWAVSKTPDPGACTSTDFQSKLAQVLFCAVKCSRNTGGDMIAWILVTKNDPKIFNAFFSKCNVLLISLSPKYHSWDGTNTSCDVLFTFY